MSIKLGDHTILVENEVEDWDNRDPDTGNPTKTWVATVVRWCQFSPTRASEDQSRSAPAISGATVLVPPRTSDGVAVPLLPTSTVVYPFSDGVDPLGRRLGRRWEIVGEIGQWDEALEVQLRRLT